MGGVGKTNTYFVRSKSMDLCDFLIRSNNLNIQISRNLATQIHGNHFRE